MELLPVVFALTGHKVVSTENLQVTHLCCAPSSGSWNRFVYRTLPVHPQRQLLAIGGDVLEFVLVLDLVLQCVQCVLRGGLRVSSSCLSLFVNEVFGDPAIGLACPCSCIVCLLQTPEAWSLVGRWQGHTVSVRNRVDTAAACAIQQHGTTVLGFVKFTASGHRKGGTQSRKGGSDGLPLGDQ